MSKHVSCNPELRRALRAAFRRPHAALALLAPGVAFAGPTGEDVVGGNANIVRPDALRTVINQVTDRAAINWQSFNVDADEYVIFNQPDSSSIVLNRVLGGDASYILGHLQANGQVFLLNPHGVYFTHGASLDVQGFLASTLDMDPADFMNGAFTLTRDANAPATGRIINDGSISAGPGGYVVLAGDYTENTGVITANAGTVALVSGNALTLDIEGDGLVNFAVDEATLSDAAGVRNAGSLIADGGRVIMTAKVANDLVATAVNNEGLVRAHSVEERDGEIYLVGYGGNVVNSGTLDADGENADGGGIAIYSDRDVTLADGGMQTAAGDAGHSGGVIRAIAEDRLDYQQDNVIRVTGGLSGGFVEVSGHGSLNLRGAPQIGAGGTFLIDPGRIHIYTGGGAPAFASSASFSYTSVGTTYLSTQLNNGVDVLLVASDEIRYDDSVGGSIVATGGGGLTVAIGTIGTTGGASDINTLGNVLIGGTPTVTPGTGGIINLTGLTVDIAGDVSLSGANIQFDTIMTAGNVVIDGANITGTSIGTGAAGTPDTVTVTATGTYPASINIANITARDSITVTADGAGPADGDITIGNVQTTSNLINGDIVLTALGGYSGGGDINIAGNGDAAGSLIINATGTGSGPGSGGNVTVTGGLDAGVNVDITATGASLGAGGGIAATSITAGNNIYLAANAGSNGGGDINVSGLIDAAGAVLVTANGAATMAGGSINLANVIAGGSMSISASGYTANVDIASADAGGAMAISATGNGTASDGGNVTVASGLLAGGNIIVNAIAPSGGDHGGNITVNGGGIRTTSGSITLYGTAGNISGGNVTVVGAGTVGVIATNGISIDASANGGAPASFSQNGNIKITGQVRGGTGAVNLRAGTATQGGSGANVIISGTGGSAGLIEGATIDIDASAAFGSGTGTNSGQIHLGNGTPENNFLGALVNATSGGASLDAQGGKGVVNAGDVHAPGMINISASGTRGQVHLGDYLSGTMTTAGDISTFNNVSVFAQGTDAGIVAGAVAGTAVSVIAQMNSSVGPGITMNGPVTATAADVIFSVTNTGGAALLALNGDVQANNNVDLNLSGIGIETLTVNGDIHANGGDVFFGSGVDVVSYGAGLHEIKANNNVFFAGNTMLAGNAGFVDYIAGGNFQYTNFSNPGTFAARDITAGGTVSVNAFGDGLHIVRDVTAGHIDMHFTGSSSGGTVNVSINSLHATGTGSPPHDVVLEVHQAAGGFASNASISVGNISTAQGQVDIRAFAAGDGADAATVTIGNVSTQNFLSIETPGDITTGTVSVNRTGGPANVDLRSFLAVNSSAAAGDITVNGNISVSGRADTSNPHAAGVMLETLPGGHSITVNGNIGVAGAGQNFSNASSNGFMGAVNFTANATGGTVDVGNVTLNGVGNAWMEVQAQTVSAGDISLSVADGNYTRNFALTDCSGASCSITGQERLISGGRAEVNINNSLLPPGGATASFGNVTLEAPSARMSVSGFANINGNAIKVNATGEHYEVSSAGTYEGVATSVNQVNHGGGANVHLLGSSAGVVQLAGGVTMQARGHASLAVHSGTIKLRGIDVEASAGTFVRSGSPSPLFEDGAFEEGGSGPRIDTGKIVGGTARVDLSGYSSASTFGSTSANAIEINGPVSVDGAGNATFRALANTIDVTGNIAVTATHAQQDGSYADSYTNFAGQLVQESGTVVSNWGHADADITAAGNVAIAGLSVSGPTAHARVEGANVRTGAVTIGASGGSLDVNETSTVDGVTTQLRVDAPNLLTGLALRADNALDVTGDINLDTIGVGGMLLVGNSIRTRNINMNVAAGDYTIKAPSLFSGNATDVTLGNAIFGVFGAPAQVNGSVNINAAGQAHVGGAVVASGDIRVAAGTGITRTIPQVVQFLNAVDSEDDDANIVLPTTTTNLQATNIRLESTLGTIRMAGSLRASQALAVSTSGNVDLRNASISGGDGSFADIAGDENFLRLLATEDIVVPAGGPDMFIRGNTVDLGNVNADGDYVFVQANALNMHGTVSTSDPDLLLQIAPLAPAAGFGFENATPRTGAYLYDGTLNTFNAATIALGTTTHSGNVVIGANGGIDIGDTNLFVLTSGTILGLERVTSSGIVKDLFTLINGTFNVPQTDEIDTSQDLVMMLNDQYALEEGRADEEEEGDEEGEDTDADTDVEEEDDSLIRQDTVDEEMMCR